MADLHEAIDKVVPAADSYLSNIWTDECGTEEQTVLLKMAKREVINAKVVSQSLKAGLKRKEIIKEKDNTLGFKIELMKHWIVKYQM